MCTRASKRRAPEFRNLRRPFCAGRSFFFTSAGIARSWTARRFCGRCAKSNVEVERFFGAFRGLRGRGVVFWRCLFCNISMEFGTSILFIPDLSFDVSALESVFCRSTFEYKVKRFKIKIYLGDEMTDFYMNLTGKSSSLRAIFSGNG